MSHIYRAYYAIQGLRNKKGMPTNAVYGFTNMLRKLIKEEQPEYLGVAIDLTGPTVRHEQYEGYKSTRRPMPDDLSTQIPFVLQVCEALCVPILSYPKYEADDVIGTLARKAAASSIDVVVVTIDKDMFQLVNDRISILDTRTMLRLDRKGVEEKFGVPPEKVVDVLSLVGDSSDNIQGAPGIGDKGAKQLIQEYGSLENLLAAPGRSEPQDLSRKPAAERGADSAKPRTGDDLRRSAARVEPRAAQKVRTEPAGCPRAICRARVYEPSRRVPSGASGRRKKVHDAGVARADQRSSQRSCRGKPAAIAASFGEGTHPDACVEGLSLAAGEGKAWFLPRQLVEGQASWSDS